ncbi:MAG: SDR family NAD(P)-dependent oxidoreductase [Acidobacteriota bacterium]|nr:SDR family NAD(P)-dependent oxidoreductase [Acidobacteriota bacterium]
MPPESSRAWSTGHDVAARALDAVLEATIVASFSRVGATVRRATQGWAPVASMEGRTILVTGASSGIGRASAIALSRAGADLWVTGRDEGRLEELAERIRAGGTTVRTAALDVTDATRVDDLARRIADDPAGLSGIIHSAGALTHEYATNAQGVETTIATHVLAPFRLTLRLAPLLRAAKRSTIVTVASGGMYTERFELSRLEMGPDDYDGVKAYARAKRAQVLLAHEWSRRWARDGVRSYVMHPGWTDTPGLATSLPTFHRLGPLLRRVDEGADTAVWLTSGAAGETGTTSGIWLDRRPRGEYYLPWTRPRRSARADGEDLWRWCERRGGLDGSGASSQ